MKKLLCVILLVFALVFLLVSCGDNETDYQEPQGENDDGTNEIPLELNFFLKDDDTYIVELGNAKSPSKTAFFLVFFTFYKKLL